MQIASNRARKLVPLVLGIITLAAVALLFAEDARPQLFPAQSHEVLAAFSLAMIACACLAYEAVRRPARSEVVKAILLACAFLFWAANQLWPASHLATLFNDIAIALFVFDVFLAITGRPLPTP